MRPADLSCRSGVDQTVIGRWWDKMAKPTSDNVRKIAKAFGRDIREAILASTSYTEEEIYGQVMKMDLTSVADEALLEEIGRRMRHERRRAASARDTARQLHVAPTPAAAHKLRRAALRAASVRGQPESPDQTPWPNSGTRQAHFDASNVGDGGGGPGDDIVRASEI